MSTDRRLSDRLEAVLTALAPCELLADVGTDHGLVPIAAVIRGIAVRAIAADLRAAPLVGAQRTIERAGVGKRVTTLRSDGLHGLVEHEPDALVMAGMSGTLMASICEREPSVLCTVRRFVAQANTGAADLRRWARRAGWQLVDERMIEEGERFFALCVFEPASAASVDPYAASAGWSEEDLLRVGPIMVRRPDPTTGRWYEAQHRRMAALVQRGATERDAERTMWEAAVAAQRAGGGPP